MQIKKSAVLRLSLIATLFSCFVLPTAKADTYSFTRVLGDNGNAFYAGNDYGDYEIRMIMGYACGQPFQTCYKTHYAATGQDVYTLSPVTLSVAPSPVAGAGCNIDLSVFSYVMRTLCVNDREIVSAYKTSPTSPNGFFAIFTGTGTSVSEIYGGTMDDVAILTPGGNLFYADGSDGTLVAGLNLTAQATTTPEPSSLVLLGTGGLACLAGWKRKHRAVELSPKVRSSPMDSLSD